MYAYACTFVIVLCLYIRTYFQPYKELQVCINMTHTVIILYIYIYCIVGNFSEVFNLANLQIYGKLSNLKSAIFYSVKI